MTCPRELGTALADTCRLHTEQDVSLRVLTAGAFAVAVTAAGMGDLVLTCTGETVECRTHSAGHLPSCRTPRSILLMFPAANRISQAAHSRGAIGLPLSGHAAAAAPCLFFPFLPASLLQAT